MIHAVVSTGMRSRPGTWLGFLPAASILLLGQAVASPEPRAVLELFLSQSCAVCRPANQLVAELAEDPSLVVLSLPVNYWDYLGWKDTLADPLFTARQKSYARARGGRQVYTPEMVVNGTLSCLGSARDQVTASIDKVKAGRGTLPVSVDVKEDNGMIGIDVGEGTGEAGALLLPVRRTRQVAIGRGENAGRTETYTNIVRGLYPLGTWSGSPIHFEIPVAAVYTKDADSYVVLLQKADGGRPSAILGAAKGPGL